MFEEWTPGFIPGLVKAGQILTIVSLGLYLGQQGPRALRQGWAVVTLFMVAGLGWSFAPPAWVAPGSELFVATALAGAAAAMSWPRMPFGLVLGALSGAALGVSAHPVDAEWPDALIVVAANLIGANLLVIFFAGLADWAEARSRRFWLRIGIRVIAAWTLAISVMMLALIKLREVEDGLRLAL